MKVSGEEQGRRTEVSGISEGSVKGWAASLHSPVNVPREELGIEEQRRSQAV